LLGLKNSPSGIDQSEAHRRRKENQIIAQVALIVGSFLLGYIPKTG